jgi:anti-sigma factor RsiW
MPCRDVLPLLQRYIDRELEAPASAAFERHLDSCWECGFEMDVYLDIKNGLAERRRNPDQATWSRLREFALNLRDDE